MALLTAADCERWFGVPNADMERKWLAMFAVDTTARFPIRVIPARIYCHRFLIGPLNDALALIQERNLATEIKTWDGCFNIRQKRGATTASLHSWALAIDMNAAWNQFGQLPTMSQALVACFLDTGWDWGGSWNKPDGMHFQLRADVVKAAVGRSHA